jgi:hypothetical protein
MQRLLLSIFVVTGLATPACAGPLSITTKNQVVRLNCRIQGSVLDFTHNHHHDYRIWSDALCSKRDMYVYLPPCYDPANRYPVAIWLHGFIQDEKNFLDLVPFFDQAIACGVIPPMIIAAPDGSISGRPSLMKAGSWYLNSHAGRYEDYVVVDVWNFLTTNFSIRPEPEAHVLAGASMGGFGAYNLGIKHRDQFKVVVGIMPPLNMRYLNCHGRYMSHFNPDCFTLAERYRPHQTIARFYGIIHIQEKQLIEPLFGKDRDEVFASIVRENPLDMLDSYAVKPGDLSMFIGYAGRDEFRIDAQVESFLYLTRPCGFEPKVVYDPYGRHNTETGVKMLPEFGAWLWPLLKPYEPGTKTQAP